MKGRYLGDKLAGDFFDIICVGCSNNSVQNATWEGRNRMERGDGFDFELVEFLDSF